MKKVVIALSGGLDSSTLLGSLLQTDVKIIACLFKYPSKHNRYELNSAMNIIKHYQNKGKDIDFLVFDLTNVFNTFNSNLLLKGDAIPEGHYEQENMKLTVVPGRNAIFTTIMAGIAESVGAESVYLGVHSGDHAIYPDCRADFVSSIKQTVALSTENKVTVETPFIHMSKKDILELGVKIEVPYELTRTCYKDQAKSCGVCGSCNERLEAFAMLNLKDPISYE